MSSVHQRPVVTVTPLDVGWSVQVAGLTREMLFATGAAAEGAARRIAARLAAAGRAATLIIRLKDGSIAGRFLFPPVLHAAVATAA